MFSVELRKPERLEDELGPVEIYLDDEAIDDLIEDLKVLKKRRGNGSPFYTTSKWGSDDLDEDTHRDDNLTIHLLKTFLIPDGNNRGA